MFGNGQTVHVKTTLRERNLRWPKPDCSPDISYVIGIQLRSRLLEQLILTYPGILLLVSLFQMAFRKAKASHTTAMGMRATVGQDLAAGTPKPVLFLWCF